MSASHYENFPVASLLCPPALRPAIAAIYCFARTADDIADEGDAAPAERLADLAAYRADLLAVAARPAPSARWPRDVRSLLRAMLANTPAAATARRPARRLRAGRRRSTRYADRAELLDYCRRSANPVGRLLLHLYGVQRRRGAARSPTRSAARCSSPISGRTWASTCRRGRLYMPAADCAPHRRRPDELLAGRDSAARLARSSPSWSAGRATLMLRGAPLGARRAGPRRLGAAAGRAGRPAHPRQDRGASDRTTLRERRPQRCAWTDCRCRCCGARCAMTSHAPRGRDRRSRMTPEQYVQEKAAQSGSQLLLRLPLPAAAAARRDHRLLRVLPRGRRRRRRGQRPRRRARPSWRGGSSEVARAFAGKPSHPVMQALMPHVAAYGIEQRAAAGGDRRLRDGPASRRATSTSRRWQRYCHLVAGVVGEVAAQHLRPDRAARPPTTRTSSGWRSSSPTSSATSARTRGAAASTCRSTSCSSSTSRRTRSSSAQLQRALRGADALPGRARAAPLRRGAGAAAATPTGARRSPGLMMASIYRTLLREIEADGFQVLHQRIALTPLRKLWIAMRDQLARALMARAPRRGRRRGLGRAGRGGRGDRARARRSPCSRWRAQLGGRGTLASTLPDGQRASTTASTSCIGAYRETLRLMRTVGVDRSRGLPAHAAALVDPKAPACGCAGGRAAARHSRSACCATRGWRWRDRIALAADGRRAGRAPASAATPTLTVAALSARLPPARARRTDRAAVRRRAEHAGRRGQRAGVPARPARCAVFGRAARPTCCCRASALADALPDAGACAGWSTRGAAIRLAQRVDALHADRPAGRSTATPFDRVILATSALEAARLARGIEPAWSRSAARAALRAHRHGLPGQRRHALPAADAGAARRRRPPGAVRVRSRPARRPRRCCSPSSSAAHRPGSTEAGARPSKRPLGRPKRRSDATC